MHTIFTIQNEGIRKEKDFLNFVSSAIQVDKKIVSSMSNGLSISVSFHYFSNIYREALTSFGSIENVCKLIEQNDENLIDFLFETYKVSIFSYKVIS